MATDLQAEKNSFYRLFKEYNKQSTLVVLVCIAIIASVISWFRAENAIDAANKASAIATTWQTMYKETERECRLAQLEIDNLKIEMVKSGIEINHGEKP